MKLIEKSFKIFCRHNRYCFSSETFAASFWIFTVLACIKLLASLYCRLKQIFFQDLVISTEYLASAVITVSSNPFVDSLPRTKIFFPLSVFNDKPLSTPKITTCLPHSLLNEN